MKKIFILLLCTSISILMSCSKDDDGYSGVSQVAKERGLREVRVNQDANSSEICYFVKENGDSITIIGDKDENGCAKSVYLMKYNSATQKLNTRFDDQMRPTSITYNNNVEITFDWIDNNRAIVKAFDPETRTYITTEWDVNNSVNSAAKAKLTRSSDVIPRSGDLKLVVRDREQPSRQTRAVPVDEISDQYCTFSVTQCNYPTDVSTWIGLMSAKPYKFIENLEYYKKVSRGVYLYRIPSGSYPSKATNQELCQNIDNWILSPLQGGLTLLAGFSSVADVITLACASTGIGVPPAAILEALTVATVVGAGTLTIFMDANGTQGLMSTFNPDWYYKEYVVSDLVLSPHIITSTDVIDLEKKQINPETQDITISCDIDGDPTIDSFILDPDFPAKGQSYVATATFHCVPVGSTIKMSIVGTDGYSDSKSVTVSTTSGIAELYVPGAETGVRDVCTVVVTPPYGESITMTASLMFGF